MIHLCNSVNLSQDQLKHQEEELRGEVNERYQYKEELINDLTARRADYELQKGDRLRVRTHTPSSSQVVRFCLWEPSSQQKLIVMLTFETRKLSLKLKGKLWQLECQIEPADWIEYQRHNLQI